MKHNMSYQEKKALVTLISSVVILACYSLYIYLNHKDQILLNPNDFRFWARTFLILIPVSIVANIIIFIVFAIINKLATNEDMPKFMDELDKLIELKATRNAHWTFVAGFFVAMTTQVMDMQPWVMFMTLVSAGFIASVISECTKLYLYRRGV